MITFGSRNHGEVGPLRIEGTARNNMIRLGRDWAADYVGPRSQSMYATKGRSNAAAVCPWRYIPCSVGTLEFYTKKAINVNVAIKIAHVVHAQNSNNKKTVNLR